MKQDIGKTKVELLVLLSRIPDNFSSWDYTRTVSYKKALKKAVKLYESGKPEKISEAYLELSGFY